MPLKIWQYNRCRIKFDDQNVPKDHAILFSDTDRGIRPIHTVGQINLSLKQVKIIEMVTMINLG